MTLKAIVGLGNPGPQFHKTRHNAGFMIIDALAQSAGCTWHTKDLLHYADCQIKGKPVILVKPQTFMNDSGAAMAFLTKKGIKPEEILVIHDELEHPLGKLSTRHGGSARGHNGLKSIIQRIGENFHRLRVGIGRPLEKHMVPTYVLEKFTPEEFERFSPLIDDAIELVGTVLDTLG